jgi:hypothetical protein
MDGEKAASQAELALVWAMRKQTGNGTDTLND